MAAEICWHFRRPWRSFGSLDTPSPVRYRDTREMPRILRALFLLVDVGFIAYWAISALHLLPAAWAFKDYADPTLSAWNWSFLPLDLAVSSTGLPSVMLARRADRRWRPLAIASLSLTMASGLQALSFWALRGDFDWFWWIPNLFLLLYPLPFLRALTLEAREAKD